MLGLYPTAWGRLINGSTDAMAEAQQLLGRTLKPIRTDWIGGTTTGDIEKYLRAAAGLDGDAKQCAAAILADARRMGNLRLVADAVELARDNAEENDETVDAELVIEAVRALAPREQEKEKRG
jgi:hypothetical protein